MLTSDRKDGRIEPMIELAALKPGRHVESLLARIPSRRNLAAE